MKQEVSENKTLQAKRGQKLQALQKDKNFFYSGLSFTKHLPFLCHCVSILKQFFNLLNFFITTKNKKNK